MVETMLKARKRRQVLLQGGRAKQAGKKKEFRQTSWVQNDIKISPINSVSRVSFTLRCHIASTSRLESIRFG